MDIRKKNIQNQIRNSKTLIRYKVCSYDEIYIFKDDNYYIESLYRHPVYDGEGSYNLLTISTDEKNAYTEYSGKFARQTHKLLEEKFHHQEKTK